MTADTINTMTTGSNKGLVLNDENSLAITANTALKWSAQLWFLVMMAGQMFFAYYVLVFYGGAAMTEGMAQWNKVLPHGYIQGDTMGNTAVAMHIFLAVIIVVGGPLQLIPQIRAKFPAFHRLNGRIYMPTVFIVSLTGVYMIWARQGDDDLIKNLGISLNAVLVMIFSVIAVRYAMIGKIAIHRRWALRMFLAASGVWFFRIGLMLWLFIHNGPVGFDPKTFEGPLITGLTYAQYLVPLIVLEAYLRTKDNAGTWGRLSMAAVLLILTVAMGVGISIAVMGMWLPRL